LWGYSIYVYVLCDLDGQLSRVHQEFSGLFEIVFGNGTTKIKPYERYIRVNTYFHTVYIFLHHTSRSCHVSFVFLNIGILVQVLTLQRRR
jgi:hypothetical protein